MREVLSRLERLEETNQALAEEIRALRKELAALRAPEPTAQAAATAIMVTDSRLRNGGPKMATSVRKRWSRP